MSDARWSDPREYGERNLDDERPRVYEERDRDDHDQLVHTVAIDHQLALLAAREVELVHQAVARSRCRSR